VTEIENGKGEILVEFRNDKKDVVIGFRADEGEFKTGDLVKIVSANKEIWRGKIESLRREKDQASSISAGTEAGMGLSLGAKYSIGDTVQAFRILETKQTL
jgi:translation initiation factor IF-2